jgi:hypothetical protein
MAEPKQTKVILIPREYNTNTREMIGQDIVDFIIRRTGDGLDVSNKPFKGYSKSYGKPGTVDLEESGDMLSGLAVVDHGPGYITIGFDSTEANDKAAWIQKPEGQKKGKQPPRQFVGISARDLARILAAYE